MERQAQDEVVSNEIGTIPRRLQPAGTVEEAAKRIIELDAEARTIALSAKTNTIAALEKACECGVWLGYAKSKLKHGEWLPWLHDLGISKMTASRYMRLAEANVTGGLLLTSRNVTHAMELAGVRKPEPQRIDDTKSGKVRLPDTLETINASFARWLSQGFDERLDNASDALLCQWEALLRPMAQTYERVKARLKA